MVKHLNKLHELYLRLTAYSSKDPGQHCSLHVIANWLSSLNFRERQSDILEKRTEGTGEWLSESQPFRDWLAGKSRMLWCSGIREQSFCTDSTFLIAVLIATQLVLERHSSRESQQDCGIKNAY